MPLAIIVARWPRALPCDARAGERAAEAVLLCRSGERKRLNDVYVLDLDTWVWSKPLITEGNPPSPREQAVAACWAGSMVLFGAHYFDLPAVCLHFGRCHVLSWNTWQQNLRLGTS
jgi:hypothetical protein